MLKRGDDLIWFPEGQRTPDGTLQPFRAGVGLLLAHVPVPVVPVVIEGAYEAWPGTSCCRACGRSGCASARRWTRGRFPARGTVPPSRPASSTPCIRISRGSWGDGAAALRRAAWVYAIAGIAFAVFGAMFWLQVSDTEFHWSRLVGRALPWAWPVVFTLALLRGPDRRRVGLLVLAYFAVLLAFCTHVALGETPPIEAYGMTVPPFVQPLILFASEAAPSLFLLLFLNRSVRAMGPVLLTLMIILAIGSQVLMIGAGTYTGLIMMARASSLLGKAFALNDPTLLVLVAVHVLGMLLFLPIGWLAIRWLRRLYEAKAFSEQTLVFDFIWLLQSLMLCNSTVYEVGWRGWLGLAAFGLYKLIAWMGLRPLAAAADKRTPARLLLLRTFGFRRRSERFFDLLGARWRYAGPIQLISAPDLATRSIDPDEFMDFLSGRLRHRFIIEPRDIDRRFAELDNRPDPDGRYRVNEFFCGNDAWRPVVTRLMADSDLVAMDLRGFSHGNQGCLFELQSLIDIVPVARAVLLTDESTDGPFLRNTLAACWQRMDARSPNRGATGALTLLSTGGRDVAAVWRCWRSPMTCSRARPRPRQSPR